MNHVLLINPEYCINCHSCELACSLKHEGNFRPAKSRITVMESELKFSVPLTCLQCERPACADVCVVNALDKNASTGVIEYNAQKCIGCRMCVSACPFGNITYDREKQSVLKCDVCQGEPECAVFCPSKAIQWVRADLETLTRQKVMSKKFEQIFTKEA